jgi:hypothetical protein
VRPLMNFLGFLLLLASAFFVASCFVLVGYHPTGGGTAAWLATFFGVPGLILKYLGSGKLCPKCAERVKSAAVKCKHCGNEIAPLKASVSASEPFYK